MLNDCKYGYRVWDSVLDIDLLRSSMTPGKDADKGKHEFTYSFLVHGSDYVNSINAEGYALNDPPKPFCGDVPEALYNNPIVDCDAENVIIDWVKQAEDGNGIIIRAYEFTGKNAKTKFTVNSIFGLKKCCICDMLENIINESEEIEFRPFEVHTIRLV